MSTVQQEWERERQGREDGRYGRPRAAFEHESHRRDYAQGYDVPFARYTAGQWGPIARLAFAQECRDGGDAYDAGLIPVQNPYPQDSEPWCAWLLGWHDARQRDS